MKKVLLSSVVAVLLLTGCGSEEKKEPVTQKVEEVKKTEPVVEKTPEENFVDQVKESTSQVATKVAEESKKVYDATSEAAKSVSEKVSQTTKEVTSEIAESAAQTKDNIEKSINEIVATKKEEVTATEINAKSLYLKCAGCHGQEAQLAALGKSKIIKDMTKEEIVSALKGYKDGTYGGVMKGVMKSQVANLSEEEIDALGEYIAAF